MSSKYEDILDKPILCLSDKGDYLYGRDCVQGGILIVGDPGSGKSSTSSKQIICGCFKAGFGALMHTTKPEDTANYVAYARECGREADVVVFSEDSGLVFDPLAYEWSRTTGRGAGMIESCVDYFRTLTSIGAPPSSSGENRFWELAAEQVMRPAIELHKLSGKQPSIANIAQVIASLPTYRGQEEEESWKDRSFTASLIEEIRQRKDTLTDDHWQDLDTAVDYIFTSWADLDPRTRGPIAATFSGLADRFMYNPMRKIFASGGFSFTPEDVTHKRAIIIVDFPILEYGKETARLIQTMIKLTFQRAWLRHKYTPGCCNGAILVQDEFQLLTSRFESFFAQTCRSSAIVNLCATQSILGLAEELGESQPGSRTKAFLNNLGVKIAHRTTCQDTATYYADTIGKIWRSVGSFNGDSHGHTSVGGAMQHVHQVDPASFSKLLRPDSSTPYSTALVFRGGDHFNATKTDRNPEGLNHLYVTFRR